MKAIKEINKKRILAVSALLIMLAGCGRQAVLPPEDITEDTQEAAGPAAAGETIEKQLQIMIDYYIDDFVWDQNNTVYYQYAVTDLDQNGRLELIASMQQGSGLYTDSYYYEVNETLDGMTQCEPANRESESGADIMTDSVPVYYDRAQHLYYYIFDDRNRDGNVLDYYNKRSILLSGGKLTEHILAYKEEEHREKEAASVTCTDADDNRISENEYNNIAGTVYAGLTQKEARFHWFDINDVDLNDVNNNELRTILRESCLGFLLQ